MHWSVAIFSSRENIETLSCSINAVLEAATASGTAVDVVVNGNRGLADKAARFLETLKGAEQLGRTIRIWYIPVADKAHAWNLYIEEILPSAEVAFFVDGYADVRLDALKLLSDALSAAPAALAASGVPTIGRSAEKQSSAMLREGGIHGNLYAVRGDFLRRARAAGFRLPLGLYRTDGVLGAVICFALDPAANEWEPRRILVHPDATWKIRPLRHASFQDLRSHWRKIQRQSQGALENLAVREHLAIQKRKPEALPRTTDELVWSWMSAHPLHALKVCAANPLCLAAAWKLRRPRDWSGVSSPPLLIAQAILA
jgi:hypothetical protein